MIVRHAVYVVPPRDTDLFRLGSAALGFDSESASALPFPAGPPFDRPDWTALTAEPRRYGLHGTLKAPFVLAPGASEADLVGRVRALAAARPPVDLGAMVAAVLGRFVALVPAGPVPGLHELAAACVRDLDDLRAPLGEDDRARRLASPLSERQIALLDRWGYPFVLEDFRFHVTLTGPLPDGVREAIRDAFAAYLGAAAQAVHIRDIAVLRQEGRGGRFRVVARCPLGG